MTSSGTSGLHRHRVGVVALAITFAFALVASGCGGNTTASDSPNGTADVNKGSPVEDESNPESGGKLVVGIPGESNGWNPVVNQWADAGSLAGSSMIEPLITLDKDGVPSGFLLEKWAHNEDFKQWDLTLKPAITFHNGEKLDGTALKGSIEASFLTGLTSVALKPVYDKVEVTGPLSVKVFLKQKMASYMVALSAAGYAMAPEMLKREDQGVLNPIGTGPFVFQEWKQDAFLKVKRFDNYWQKDKDGKSKVYLDEIEFRPIPDDSTKEKAMQSKDVDVVLTTSSDVTNRLEGLADEFKVIRDGKSERTYLQLNTAEGEQNKGNPFTNIHARKAVAYATNRQAIADLIGNSLSISTSPYRNDSKWALPEDQTGALPYDPEKAKAELELYKKDTGKSELTFKFTGLTVAEDLRLMQALQAQWQEVGISSTVDAIEQVKFISIFALGFYQLTWSRLYGGTDPDSNYVFFSQDTVGPVGGLSINFAHYSSSEMQKNLRTVRENEDFATRKAANDKIIKELNEQVTHIWLFDTPYALIARKNVYGLNIFRTQPFGNFNPKPYWNDVWIKK